jgi:hypothetical protein
MLYTQFLTIITKQAPLERYFPEYAGGPDVNKAAKYLLWKFMQENRARLAVYPQCVFFPPLPSFCMISCRIYHPSSSFPSGLACTLPPHRCMSPLIRTLFPVVPYPFTMRRCPDSHLLPRRRVSSSSILHIPSSRILLLIMRSLHLRHSLSLLQRLTNILPASPKRPTRRTSGSCSRPLRRQSIRMRSRTRGSSKC